MQQKNQLMLHPNELQHALTRAIIIKQLCFEHCHLSHDSCGPQRAGFICSTTAITSTFSELHAFVHNGRLRPAYYFPYLVPA